MPILNYTTEVPVAKTAAEIQARLARAKVQSVMTPDALFVLLVFGAGRAHYVSNANRDEMVKALREIADQVEASEKPRPRRKRKGGG